MTRIFTKLVAEGLIQTAASCPSDVLVVVPSDERRTHAVAVAAQLRAYGINTELYHQSDKLAKQIRYASRKGIPVVWFPPFENGRPHEVKIMATGEQIEANPVTWTLT